MAQTTFIYNQSDIETQTVTIADIVNQTKERGSKFFTLHSLLFTPAVIYRKHLKAYRRMAAWADRHETLLNVITAAQAVAFMVYIVLYY